MKYCRNCGFELPDDSKFCEKCGETFSDEAQKYLVELDTSNLLNEAKKTVYYPISDKDINFATDEIIYCMRVAFGLKKPVKLFLSGPDSERAQPVIFLMNNENIRILGSNYSVFRVVSTLETPHRRVSTEAGEWRISWFLNATVPINQISSVKDCYRKPQGPLAVPDFKPYHGVEIKLQCNCDVDIHYDLAGRKKFLHKTEKRKEFIKNQKMEITLFPIESTQLLNFKKYFSMIQDLGVVNDKLDENVSELYDKKFKMLPKIIKEFSKNAQQSTINSSLNSRVLLLHHIQFGDRPDDLT